MHSNVGSGKLGYMYISEQPSVYATQHVSTELPVPSNTGATVAHPRGNLTAAVISATTRAHKENIRIWKEYTNATRAAKQVIFNHVLDTCYLSLKKKYTGYVNNMYLDIYNNLIEEYEEFSDDKMQENDMLMKK